MSAIACSPNAVSLAISLAFHHLWLLGGIFIVLISLAFVLRAWVGARPTNFSCFIGSFAHER
jgi:hypothetical protein